MAWPSARDEQEFLGLSASHVKRLHRRVFEDGILVMRDHPQGRRCGRRGPDSKIVLEETFGFDLSPLAQRYDEFIRIAAEARTEREHMRKLRRRATLARRAITQAGEALERAGGLPPNWPQLKAEVTDLTAAGRRAKRSDVLALIVAGLERRKEQAEQWLQDTAPPVNLGPQGLMDEPPTTTTDTDPNNLNTVEEAAGDCSLGPVEVDATTPEPTEVATSTPEPVVAVTGIDPAAGIAPDELIDLAPRLGAWVTSAGRWPTWNDVLEAAPALCTEMEIPRRLWVEACGNLGCYRAAMALAIVSTKPAGYFRKGAAAYFTAMMHRAARGQLNLERSFWKLRRDQWRVH
jgi:replication initiation protein RepC